ncbi:DUF5000 domain-containing lipoprotein [Olivibacter sp. CPCC 100613]|uniref:DUF5000 domain-containing lipoprotein n=1 Tax=Olivibacter sp. CPCC 100613 TaxID=3079931 RepID=UPI002FF4A5AB
MRELIRNMLNIGCIFLCILFNGCKDTLEPAPLRSGDKPQAITAYKVQPIAGGAIITYDLPVSQDLRYVKAVYTLGDGSIRENKSSLYKNTITVDGFATAGEYPVELIAVGVGEIESDPTSLNVTTLTPPYLRTLELLGKENNMMSTFGGIRLQFENETEAPIVIHILAKDDGGEWKPALDHYTRLPNGVVNVRGYPAEERTFGVYITDRWNNRSDTLTGTYLPIFEMMMDKSLFKTYNLATDEYTAHAGFGTVNALWNGVSDADGGTNIFHTRPGTGMPQHFTFDMGVKATLSRFVMHSRRNHEYRFNHPQRFELWGSNEPTSDGGWDSWTLIGTFSSIKPSGLPLGEQTADDLAYARAGEEFDVEMEGQAFRYWRWKTLETWGGNSDVSMAELTFYGETKVD